MAKGNPRIKNINSGVSTSPELYSGYDVLHYSLRKTIQPSSLLPGYYEGRVIHLQRIFDPQSEFKFCILAHINGIDSSTEEPGIYGDMIPAEYIGKETFYYPIDNNVEMPYVGAPILMYMEDPRNRIGYYCGLSDRDVKIEHIESGNKKSITEIEKASKKFKD